MSEMPSQVVRVKKPPYKIPSMEEIRQRPKCGVKVVSTFSGCGGSCLGYEMAGCEIVLASEFIPEARKTYMQNHLGVNVDPRDIRKVSPEDILDEIKMKPGELDVFEGSPPCASFSTAGRQEEGWSQVRSYSDSKQRVDDLFWEWARLLKGLQPKIFSAENVYGLAKGKAKGYFIEICELLENCGYEVETRVLDAQWLGVPQMRQRCIFIGTRKDLNIRPLHPFPHPYRYVAKDAIPYMHHGVVDTHGQFPVQVFGDTPIPTVRGSSSHQYKIYTRTGSQFAWEDRGVDLPIPTVRSTIDNIMVGEPQENGELKERRFTIEEMKKLCAFPDDFILTGTYAQQWERLGRAVPPPMMQSVAACVKKMLGKSTPDDEKFLQMPNGELEDGCDPSALFRVGYHEGPREFQIVNKFIDTEHECPKCGYKWSGSPRKRGANEEADTGRAGAVASV